MSTEDNTELTATITNESTGDQIKDDEKENNEQEQKTVKDLEKEQEAKLRSKYPKVPPSSALLQKRLSKGSKFFDSGDYNMAKAKMVVPPGKMLPPTQKPPIPIVLCGEVIPTPETVPLRKSSIAPPGLKFHATGALS